MLQYNRYLVATLEDGLHLLALNPDVGAFLGSKFQRHALASLRRSNKQRVAMLSHRL
jgi:hypothetical protein